MAYYGPPYAADPTYFHGQHPVYAAGPVNGNGLTYYGAATGGPYVYGVSTEFGEGEFTLITHPGPPSSLLNRRVVGGQPRATCPPTNIPSNVNGFSDQAFAARPTIPSIYVNGQTVHGQTLSSLLAPASSVRSYNATSSNLNGRVGGQVPPPSNANGQVPPPSNANGQVPPPSNVNGQVPPPMNVNGQVPPPLNVKGQVPPSSNVNGQVPLPSNVNGQGLSGGQGIIPAYRPLVPSTLNGQGVAARPETVPNINPKEIVKQPALQKNGSKQDTTEKDEKEGKQTEKGDKDNNETMMALLSLSLKALEKSVSQNQPQQNNDNKNSAEWEDDRVSSDPSTDPFEVKIDVRNFAYHELSVMTVDRFVVVEGRHEKNDGHGFISRSFTRRYELPDNVYPEEVACKMSSDGYLVISTPDYSEYPIKSERSVPIRRVDEEVDDFISSSAPTDRLMY